MNYFEVGRKWFMVPKWRTFVFTHPKLIVCRTTLGCDYSCESFVCPYQLCISRQQILFCLVFFANALNPSQTGWRATVDNDFKVSPHEPQLSLGLAFWLWHTKRWMLQCKPSQRISGCVFRDVVLLEGEANPQFQVFYSLEQFFLDYPLFGFIHLPFKTDEPHVSHWRKESPIERCCHHHFFFYHSVFRELIFLYA